MTLTTPRGFAGGPMADIDYGMAACGSGWAESAAALAVTQPNGGTRTVSVAPGTGVAFGVRVTNDAALTQALAAPSSGGAWYLIALRFNWNTKTVTLQAIAGPTSGSTAAPTAIPTTMPGGGYSNTPGNVYDLPLAWAFVNSANTTVTLFDLRLLATGAGNVSAVNLWGLIVGNMSGLFTAGALVSVQTFQLASGGYHERSTWQRRADGPFEPVGSIMGNEAPGNVRDYLVGIATAGYTTSFRLPGTDARFVDSNGRITYQWNGSKWCPWDSPWTNFDAVYTAISLGGGFTASGRQRWTSGRKRVQTLFTLGSSPSISGGVTMTLPEPVAYPYGSPQSPVFEGQTVVRDTNGRLYRGPITGNGENAASCALGVDQVDGTWKWGNAYAAGQPIAAASGQQVWTEVVYESANYPLV